MDVVFETNGTHLVWKVNNSTFRGDYNVALLDQVKQGNLTFADDW